MCEFLQPHHFPMHTQLISGRVLALHERLTYWGIVQWLGPRFLVPVMGVRIPLPQPLACPANPLPPRVMEGSLHLSHLRHPPHARQKGHLAYLDHLLH